MNPAASGRGIIRENHAVFTNISYAAERRGIRPLNKKVDGSVPSTHFIVHFYLQCPGGQQRVAVGSGCGGSVGGTEVGGGESVGGTEVAGGGLVL